ncbi:Uncharacterized protein Adt_43327 [Abeliophyllum distichum]|uniref:Uncharacterized protein n=1 Tax=Abeliophyllum distichum TaxID=126358 RepID=A0ABD1P850_9LAMI
MSGRLQQVNTQPEGSMLCPRTTISKSPPSGNHSSSSGFCCSTGVKQSSPVNASTSGDALLSEQTGPMLKRSWSEAQLHEFEQEDSELLVRSYSHKIVSEHASTEAPPPVPKDNNIDTLRVKVTFGKKRSNSVCNLTGALEI